MNMSFLMHKTMKNASKKYSNKYVRQMKYVFMYVIQKIC